MRFVTSRGRDRFYNFSMVNTISFSITLPSYLLECLQERARKESRSLNDLIQQALVDYELRPWRQQSATGGRRSRAAQAGQVEADAEGVTHVVRNGRVARNRSHAA